MAEIATEDGTREQEEEEAASEKSSEGGGKEGEGEEGGEKTGNEEQRSSEAGASSDTNVSQVNLESDSDTEDEEEQEVVTKSSTSNSYTHSSQTAPQTRTGAAQPPFSASCVSSSPSALPSGGQSVISGITVTESAVPPGTPPSPGRCISVSSPGRGHKIFMVTRVESPPEQQQLQIPTSAPPAPSQTKEVSKKPVDTNTQPVTPAPTQSTQLTQEDVEERSPAQSVDCKPTEQSPVAHSESALNHTQAHTLEPQCQLREDVTACTLDPEVTDPNLQAPALPSDSLPLQAATPLLTVEVTESTTSPQPEPTCVEGEKKEEDPVEDNREVMSPDNKKEECKLGQTQNNTSAINMPQKQITSAAEQLQNELTSASEETQSPNQTEEEDGEKALSQKEKQEAPTSLSEIKQSSLTENEGNLPNKEQPKEKQQIHADEEREEPVLSVQTDRQEQSVIQSGAQEANPQGDEASQSHQSATTGSVSPAEVEDSPDESSADEVEFAEALEGEVVGSALPNGLKPEFSLHLLDAESPKPSSCVMEHGASL